MAGKGGKMVKIWMVLKMAAMVAFFLMAGKHLFGNKSEYFSVVIYLFGGLSILIGTYGRIYEKGYQSGVSSCSQIEAGNMYRVKKAAGDSLILSRLRNSSAETNLRRRELITIELPNHRFREGDHIIKARDGSLEVVGG